MDWMENASILPRGFRFGAFEVDLKAGGVRKHGLRVRLQEQPFRILTILLRRPGEVVTREDLRKELWPADTFVDFDHGLNNAMNRLREALGDSADAPRFIETLPRSGYRFTAAVESLLPPAPAAASVAPRQPLSRRAALAALAVVLLAVGYSVWGLRTARPAPSSRLMLAVLPFDNLSGDPQNEYLSDGLTEEMIAQLGHLEPLHLGVIARTSAMQYKRTRKRIDEVGRELGVDYVLEGSVRRSGEHLRITASLIQASDQADVWTQSYEGRMADSLAFESEAARAIADGIRIQIRPEARARLGSASALGAEAHELYLRGRYQLNKRTEEGLRKGLEYFRQAIDLEPGYALAHSGLADSYLLLGAGDYAVVPPREAMPKAKAAAIRALELDPTLAEAHTTLAFIHYTYDWDWAGADDEFRRARELDPNYATAPHWHSLYLKSMGRREEALAEARRALALDPLSLIIGTDLAWSLYHLREYDRAVAQCRKILDLDPDFAVAHWNLGLAYAEKGAFDPAVAELRRAATLTGRSPVQVAALGRVYALAGRTGDARDVLAELAALSARRYVSPADLSMVHAALGEKDEAFRLLEKAYEERSDVFVNLKVDPRLDPLRSDPRFTSLLRRVGLAS